jgi:hypothetical protein
MGNANRVRFLKLTLQELLREKSGINKSLQSAMAKQL